MRKARQLGDSLCSDGGVYVVCVCLCMYGVCMGGCVYVCVCMVGGCVYGVCVM